MRSTRCGLLGAGLLVLALTGLTGCGPDQVDPGIDPHSPGPLGREEAELLVEGPFTGLLESLSEVADGEALEQVEGGTVARVGGECLWTTPVHAGLADMSVSTWGELAETVRPSVKAWGMEEDLLDRVERSAGAGLVAENPANGARLDVQGWNPPPTGDEPPADPGSHSGFSVQVSVPLHEAECEG